MTDPQSSVILPGAVAAGGVALTDLPEVVWLRNPKTGIIYRFHHVRDVDTLTRVLGENYTLSDEGAARAQAVELARLQGRELPPWAATHAPRGEVTAEESASAGGSGSSRVASGRGGTSTPPTRETGR